MELFIKTDANGSVIVFDTVIALVATIFVIGGGIWVLLGTIRFARSLNDKNSPGLQQSLWQIAGGFGVIVVSVLYRELNLDFNLVANTLFYASKLVEIISALWIFYGILLLAENLRNTNAASLGLSVWQIIGGVLAFLVSNIFSKTINI